MSMGDSGQFIWAMWDSGRAALVGLNLVPVVVVSLFVGMASHVRGLSWLKALVSLVPAVMIVALWPMTSGYQPIWPDLTQLESQIQIVVEFATGFTIVLVAGLLKSALYLGANRPGSHKIV